MTAPNPDMQSVLNKMFNDAISECANLFAVDLPTVLAALDDTKADAPTLLEKMK